MARSAVRRPLRPARRAAWVAALAAALVVPAGAPLVASAAADEDRGIRIAGSLQSELGCSSDWQADCDAGRLTQVGEGSAYEGVLELPAGSYELKVTVGGSWTENYGLDGAPGGANIPLVLGGDARVRFGYDDTTHRVTMTPETLGGPATEADRALATDSLRAGLTKERFYFVMADRFANGNKANDRGGLTGDRLATGYDPTDKGFYHGGDLAGVMQKLDYIANLGTTAIWLTPSFQNRPVQGTGADASAGYHGYWVTDFTRIDPHLGTNAEMKALIDAAHRKGMKVFFDIITNHTADVIRYAENEYSYVDKATEPYRDADGAEFDDAAVAGTDAFPPLDAATSFPYTPEYATPADATARTPSWLNDPTMYHNRGDSTFAGESSTYGDFVGLDDLFTERPEVVEGMGDIYKTWVDFGIDGFRIDTVKHVNMQFWQAFSPDVLEHAKEVGNDDFFMFGEVYDSSPAYQSQYTTTGRLPATLDFGFQGAATSWVQGNAGTDLRDFFAGDDWYTDTDSNAYSLPTFLGNHDMGRVAMMLKGSSADDAQLLSRVKLANSLMFLTRGQPVVYYGDEQGFVGAGGDKDARQDMFATKVAQYADEADLFGRTGSVNRFGSTALYQQIRALSDLRAKYPGLSDGAQVHRYASSGAGVYAFSRIAQKTGRELLVVANNAATPASATFTTDTPASDFVPVYGGGATVRSGADTRVSVTVPPMSVRVYRSSRQLPARSAAPDLVLTSPTPGATVGGRTEVRAGLADRVSAQVSFVYRPVGTTDWLPVGTDDNAPYRVFHDVSGLAAGTLVEYRAVARDASGNLSASSSSAVVGTPTGGGGGGGPTGPVEQPAAVSVPGSTNSELGCPGDWQPDCEQAQLALDPDDGIWKGTFDLPAGSYEYKVAIDRGWDENYGAGGVRGGSNITLTLPEDRSVTFFYDHRTHGVTTDVQGPVVTAPGSFQSELGCPGDWSPDCMNPWLQDLDGDGVYSWSGSVPAGSYEFKVAHGLSWTENYGAGGVRDGANIAVSVPSDGVVLTIDYTLSTHVATTSVTRPGASPDLTKAKAFWVEPDLLAWPSTGVPQGVPTNLLDWRLHWSRSGGMTVDAEAVLGRGVADLTIDPAGLPASVVTAHPELEGYLALRLAPGVASQAGTILRGQVAVGLYDDLGRVLDATGVQTPGVLDALYAGSAADRAYGPTFDGSGVTYRVWAPTAASVALVAWSPGSATDAPVSAARRVPMTRADDGSWSVRSGSRNARYLFEVRVVAPSTGELVTNLVTDPWSTGLTLNSTRSVAVDLAQPAYRPALWRTTPVPPLPRAVDTTVYELHVRDFSIGDPTVSAANRGSYLAFAEDGAGTRHLRALAAAGLNTVHLLPTFDIASIEEDPARQTTPDCDLASFAPDSPEQQACVEPSRAGDGFNWGYDPWHYSVPEGSYASSAAAAEGGSRVAEFRTMVGALHRDGLRVVLDQVFNHTAASGQDAKSVLDRIVPGYYHRLDATGAVQTSTCCQNVATEHAMAQKLMVDSVVRWARDYKVDGFRFDLMGHHSRANMLAIRSALDALTMSSDGVDGSQVYLYGEGWNFGEVADDALFEQATQGNLGGTGIGTFSDRLRDAVRGGGPFDEDPRRQGFGSGEWTDPNGAAINDGAEDSLAHDTDLVQLGLAGNLRSFSFRLNGSGEVARGDQVDYNGQPAGYADEPDEVVTYVDAHDNETLFDSLTFKLPVATSMSDRVRMNTLSLATTALSQTPSFWHAGADLLRSKSLDRNSYDSGDWFNTLDWTGADNGFGRGLPPQGDNADKWDFMRPLLGDAALKPARSDVEAATAQAQDLLRLRFSTPLLRLGSAAAINAKVSFPASGTDDALPGVVAMRVDDTVGADADPALDGIVVVFNATPDAVSQVVPGAAGAAMQLSPVQADGADPVVKGATWDAATGTATVPPRTVAVFVQP